LHLAEKNKNLCDTTRATAPSRRPHPLPFTQNNRIASSWQHPARGMRRTACGKRHAADGTRQTAGSLSKLGDPFAIAHLTHGILGNGGLIA